MIDPKELRLGNYILNIEGAIDEVWSLEHNEEYSINNWFSESDIRPVPTTLQVLEACGIMFMSLSSIFTFSLKLPNDGEIDIVKMTYDGQCDACVRQSGGDLGIRVAFQYLHQLQNLYHALTGKELEIDEEKLRAAMSANINP